VDGDFVTSRGEERRADLSAQVSMTCQASEFAAQGGVADAMPTATA